VSLVRCGALLPRSRALRRFLGSRMVASCPAWDTLHRTALLRRVRWARRELQGYLQAANLGNWSAVCQSSRRESFDNTPTLSSRTAVPIRMPRSSLVTASDGLESRCHLGGQHMRSCTFIRVFPLSPLRRPPSNEVRLGDTVPAQGMSVCALSPLQVWALLRRGGSRGSPGAPRPPACDPRRLR
jgi:hypothetical protein